MHDRALELLAQVGTSRAQEDGTWREVGTALGNVECAVLQRHRELAQNVDFGKRSLEHAFLVWSRKNHSFDSVRGGRCCLRLIALRCAVSWLADVVV